MAETLGESDCDSSAAARPTPRGQRGARRNVIYRETSYVCHVRVRIFSIRTKEIYVIRTFNFLRVLR